MGETKSLMRVSFVGVFTAVRKDMCYTWWRRRDLNPGPTDYDSAALTT